MTTTKRMVEMLAAIAMATATKKMVMVTAAETITQQTMAAVARTKKTMAATAMRGAQTTINSKQHWKKWQ
jgi:hypothetical protein